MNCERTTTALEGSLASRIDPAMLSAATQHAATCPACAAALDEHGALAALRAQLPATMTPARPLWTGIEARLQPRSRIRSWRLVPGLAAAALAGILLVSSDRSRPEAPSLPESVTAEVAAYRDAARELEQALRSGTIRIPAASIRAIEAPLARIDGASAEVRVALGRDPANSSLQLAYLATMRHRLALLRQVAQMEGTE